jgi:hypothetical protein
MVFEAKKSRDRITRFAIRNDATSRSVMLARARFAIARCSAIKFFGDLFAFKKRTRRSNSGKEDASRLCR